MGLSFVPSGVFSHLFVGRWGLTGERLVKSMMRNRGIMRSLKELVLMGLYYDVPKQAGMSKEEISGTRIKAVRDKDERIFGLYFKGAL